MLVVLRTEPICCRSRPYLHYDNFVYAIRDDIFTDTDRTKFFDFIIPVIPIINSTNSGEIFLQKLQKSLVRMAKVTAWIAGDDFVSPADVSAQFIPVVNHRVRLGTRARMDGAEKENVQAEILEREERPFFRGR